MKQTGHVRHANVPALSRAILTFQKLDVISLLWMWSYKARVTWTLFLIPNWQGLAHTHLLLGRFLSLWPKIPWLRKCWSVGTESRRSHNKKVHSGRSYWTPRLQMITSGKPWSQRLPKDTLGDLKRPGHWAYILPKLMSSRCKRVLFVGAWIASIQSICIYSPSIHFNWIGYGVAFVSLCGPNWDT